jgi:hypothetical protein
MKRITDITKEELELMYKTISPKALAMGLGVAVPTLLNILRRNGIEVKRRGRPRKFAVMANEVSECLEVIKQDLGA